MSGETKKSAEEIVEEIFKKWLWTNCIQSMPTRQIPIYILDQLKAELVKAFKKYNFPAEDESGGTPFST